MIWQKPYDEEGIICSNNELPSNIIQLIKKRWLEKRPTYDFIEEYRKKFYIEKKIDIVTPNLPKTAEHALGDLSEACVEISLLRGWEMCEEIKSKWIHPMSGSAPGRGIDIVCFSNPGVNDYREGIWLFEVKGASTESSAKTQCGKVKNYINRKEDQIRRELIELDSWINQLTSNQLELSMRIAKFLMQDPPNIHLSGGLLLYENFMDAESINDFKNKIRSFSRDLREPGLIFLFSNEIKELIQSYLKGEAYE